MTTGTYLLGAFCIVGLAIFIGVLVKLICPFCDVTAEDFDDEDLRR